MEKKYISENRYKKVARSDRKKRTIARNKKSKSIKKVPVVVYDGDRVVAGGEII